MILNLNVQMEKMGHERLRDMRLEGGFVQLNFNVPFIMKRKTKRFCILNIKMILKFLAKHSIHISLISKIGRAHV